MYSHGEIYIAHPILLGQDFEYDNYNYNSKCKMEMPPNVEEKS